jgi:putative transposase
MMKKSRTVPRVIVTDKLRSLNNRAENRRQPTRQRERAMKGFRSVGGAQRFLSAFSGISPHFRPRRHLMPAHGYVVLNECRLSMSSDVFPEPVGL